MVSSYKLQTINYKPQSHLEIESYPICSSKVLKRKPCCLRIDLKWRQQGGYGRFSISIANIHPHEAVPAEKIFQTLKNITGFEWTYFYANNETEL